MTTQQIFDTRGIIVFSNTIKHDNFYPKVNIAYPMSMVLKGNDNVKTYENDDGSVTIDFKLDRDMMIRCIQHLMDACNNKGSSFKANIFIEEADDRGRITQTFIGNIPHLQRHLKEFYPEGSCLFTKATVNREKNKRYFQLLKLPVWAKPDYKKQRAKEYKASRREVGESKV